MSQLISADQFLDAAAHRRTIYALTDKPPVSVERVQELAEKVLKSTPSAFNSQTSRIHVIVGDEHKRLWSVIVSVAKPYFISTAGEATWKHFEPIFAGFAAAYGTALFFEDGDVIEEWKKNKPSVAGMMGQYSEHTSAMHQIHLWTALELDGFGASLQHYGGLPGVEAALQEHFGVPKAYSAKAQMVFGGKADAHPAAPEKLPFSKTLKILA